LKLSDSANYRATPKWHLQSKPTQNGQEHSKKQKAVRGKGTQNVKSYTQQSFTITQMTLSGQAMGEELKDI